ncbi:MAG TPA: T9SS type A sorting domain-containing protein, partial [Candidatus Cloacimonetes bacterium]|nr:T9SS type A sorting domain-containing protein [Candidatus Cloacimonadota bacterium]
WEWDLDGDDITDSNEQDPTWIYTEVGSYTVSFTVDFGDEQITETKENFIIVEPVAINDQNIQPAENHLYNYPNPFSLKQDSITEIKFSLKQKGFVQINIYNAKGQKIKTLIKKEFEAGFFSTFWNGKNEKGKNVQSGVYFYKLNIDGREVAKKMLILE